VTQSLKNKYLQRPRNETLVRGFEGGSDRGGRRTEDAVNFRVIDPGGLHALLRNRNVRCPYDGIQKKLTVVVVLPVGVVVAQRCPNAAAGNFVAEGARAVVGPDSDLLLGFGWWPGKHLGIGWKFRDAQQGSDAVIDERGLVVKLVHDVEGFHAIHNWVMG